MGEGPDVVHLAKDLGPSASMGIDAQKIHMRHLSMDFASAHASALRSSLIRGSLLQLEGVNSS